MTFVEITYGIYPMFFCTCLFSYATIVETHNIAFIENTYASLASSFSLSWSQN